LRRAGDDRPLLAADRAANACTVALDIADPEHPREVSNVTFCDDEEPHCAASQITIQGARYPEAMERMSNR
jgi:hypothetical protein